MGTNEAKWEAKRVEQAANGEWLWCVYDKAGMVVASRLPQERAEYIATACSAYPKLQEELEHERAVKETLAAEVDRVHRLVKELVSAIASRQNSVPPKDEGEFFDWFYNRNKG